jgi:NAD(P)-dependent dehydrogenase (short-subunit alcohol dehydrogenase family)
VTPRAIVTGGAQGIGRGIAERLRGEGWEVAVLDIDAEALSDLSGVRALEADVADEAAVAQAFAALGWNRLDLLVSNAGMADPVSGSVEDLALGEWRRRVDSHLTAAFLVTRAAVPLLRERGGSIVLISSTRALQSEPGCEAYAAAKGGLVALAHALAVSLGPGIRANAVLPGWIAVSDWQKPASRREPDLREIDHAQHPAGRVGRPVDVADAVLYLASAGFVTGQTLVVDGGMTRRMIYAD